MNWQGYGLIGPQEPGGLQSYGSKSSILWVKRHRVAAAAGVQIRQGYGLCRHPRRRTPTKGNPHLEGIVRWRGYALRPAGICFNPENAIRGICHLVRLYCEDPKPRLRTVALGCCLATPRALRVTYCSGDSAITHHGRQVA